MSNIKMLKNIPSIILFCLFIVVSFSCNKESCYEDKSCDYIDVSFTRTQLVIKNNGYKEMEIKSILFYAIDTMGFYYEFPHYYEYTIKKGKTLKLNKNNIYPLDELRGPYFFNEVASFDIAIWHKFTKCDNANETYNGCTKNIIVK